MRSLDTGEFMEIQTQRSQVECDALDEWAAVAKLEPGQPVFREVVKGGHIGNARLSDRSVARIIKRRVRERALELGRSEVR